MAFPAVEATAESSTNTAGTSHVVTLPAGIAAGDLLLILLDKGSTAASFNALAGWTELVDENLANGITIWARQADGTEGATVTFTSTASTRSACIAYRISGAELLAIQAPQLSTVATGTSTAPNATTCTPTGGAKDYLWISMFGMAGEEADDDTWCNTPPLNFLPSPPLQKSCGTAGTNLGGLVAAATRQVNAASQDAGAFATDVSLAWRAYTIAVHPSSASLVAATPGQLTVEAVAGTPVPGTVATRTATNGTAGTSQLVILPDGSNIAGRLALVVLSNDGATATWPTGWTELFDTGVTGVSMSAAYRFIDGTEVDNTATPFDGTDDTIAVGTSASVASNYHAYLFLEGHHASTPPEAAVATPATPDPPSLDPAGWATEDTIWIAASACRFAANYTAAPADYTDLLSLNGGDSNAPLGSARRTLNTGAEDPGVFTETGGNTNFVTATIAVRPTGGGGSIVAATPGQVTIQAVAGTPVPGMVTIAATPGQLTLEPKAGIVPSVTVGAIAQLTLAPVAATPVPGMVTVSAAPATLTVAPVAATPVPGMVTVAAAVGTITLQPVAATPTIELFAAVAELTLQPIPATPVPGPVTVASSPATLTLQPVPGIVRTYIAATPGHLTLAPVAATPLPGPVTVAALPGTITLQPIPGAPRGPIDHPPQLELAALDQPRHLAAIAAPRTITAIPAALTLAAIHQEE